MSGFKARAYSDDVEALVALARQARPAAWVTDYPGANDLREMLADASVQKNTRVWKDGNRDIAAYALVDDFNNLLFDVRPDAHSKELDAGIFGWGIECLVRHNAESGTHDTLDAVCRAEDRERAAWLEHFGFVRQPLQTVRMARALREPIEEPTLPDGFVLRAIEGVREAEALAALHRAAFGSDYMTAEKRLAWMATPHYDAALDLVIVAPDGSLAASCFGSIDPEGNARTGRAEGSLDPVATHPNFQRLGLARACLVEGMRRLKERGVEYAVLGTSSENAAMQRAARAAGFEIDSVRVWYCRTLQVL